LLLGLFAYSVLELKNAVKVKRGKETFIFRSGKSEDKKALLAAFKKVAEEMSNKRRKESVWEAETRKGVRLPQSTFLQC